MAATDLRTFLEEALQRFDPDLDVSEGSRAQTDLIDPIMARIGLDPFDNDILTFIRDRVRQSFPDLAITEADELTDLLIDPMRVIIEPVVREIKLVQLRRSLRNIESLADDEVDALLGNFFEARRAGGYAVGVVRAYFSAPQSLSITTINPASTGGGLRFLPTRPQQITADQMLLNLEGSEYYFDINYTSENRGTEYNVEPGEIKNIANLPTATRVTNARRFRGGIPRETSLDYAARVQSSSTNRTLVSEPGILATLQESFPAIRKLFSVGFRDPEMQRDVVQGGGLGPIVADDDFGSAYGTATITDDLDGDLTSPIIQATDGHFVSRIGAAGTSPSGWYLTLVYTTSALQVVDSAISRVISDTEVECETEIPLGTPVTWMLRRRTLTISDIPGGITLPNSVGGTLEITEDRIHIGGKVDIYLAGETESVTSQITALSDEYPLARGYGAQTDASDEVLLADIDPDLFEQIEIGMSLVLEEGEDSGAYRILGLSSPDTVVVDTSLTGTQADLSWRIVDEIDVELTDPKEIRVTGDDLVTAAGSDNVTTSSSTNFQDAGVQPYDILEIQDDDFGGDFTILGVSATGLFITPEVSRTLGAVPYRIFRRSEPVRTPVVRVSGLELLDSGGAPSGTIIPQRDPVLAVGTSFQNEAADLFYDGIMFVGLTGVTPYVGSSTAAVGGTSLHWSVWDLDAPWAAPISGILTFTPGSKTLAQIISAFNSSGLAAQGVTATSVEFGGASYLTLICQKYVRLFNDNDYPALTPLGMYSGASSSSLRRVVTSLTSVEALRIRRGDRVEFVDGGNSGVTARVVNDPASGTEVVELGMGPEAITGMTAGSLAPLRLRPGVANVRIGRPSVGSVRVFFQNPTSIECDYLSTTFTAVSGGRDLVYVPDPLVEYTLLPAYPETEPVLTGNTQIGTGLVDERDFRLLGIKIGDVVELLYQPVMGTSALPSPADVDVSGLTLILRLGKSPFITISFPYDMPRQQVADYINDRVGEDIASLDSGALKLVSAERLEISAASTALTVLFLSATTNEYPYAGKYIVSAVNDGSLALVPSVLADVAEVAYRVTRYMQRCSSTQMAAQLDASGLYYADFELVSAAPGNDYNLAEGAPMEVADHRSDGYRLTTDNSTLSYSRAEILRAELSRTMILPGSPDSAEEAIQLSQQNVQVSYDRSQLVDSVQSFVDSDFQRVRNSEPLVRHLLPHYVRLVWTYVGGKTEPEMVRALEDALESIEAGQQLEVGDLITTLRKRGATSVYTPDSSSPTGRTAPMFVVIYHDLERRVRGLIVKDYVDTVRTQRYIPDNLQLRRLAGTFR